MLLAFRLPRDLHVVLPDQGQILMRDNWTVRRLTVHVHAHQDTVLPYRGTPYCNQRDIPLTRRRMNLLDMLDLLSHPSNRRDRTDTSLIARVIVRHHRHVVAVR